MLLDGGAVDAGLSFHLFIIHPIQLLAQEMFEQLADLPGDYAVTVGKGLQPLQGPTDIDTVATGVETGCHRTGLLIGNQPRYLIGHVHRRIEGEHGDG